MMSHIPPICIGPISGIRYTDRQPNILLLTGQQNRMSIVIEDVDDGASSSHWTKHFSETHKTNYWFNNINGQTSWKEPDKHKHERKRLRESDLPETLVSNDSMKKSSKNGENSLSSVKSKPTIAIIVPYRDLHKEQSRKQQLDLFIPSITKFMGLNRAKNQSYRIYIIEQSNDERKFNRGKLLNIGFQIACSEGCKALIFHDVDLLPSSGI